MCTLCTKCTYFLKIAGGKSLQRAKQLTIGELYVYDKTVKITPPTRSLKVGEVCG
jgi:hypothetical protein